MTACFGHTHKPISSAVEGETWDSRHLASTWEDLEAPVHFVNPGSVGYSRDEDPRAAIALWDPYLHRLRGVRVPYAIECSADRMRKAGLPQDNIVRLLTAQ